MPSTPRLGCLYFFWIRDVLNKPCTTVILRSPVAARFRILGHAIVLAAHLLVGNWISSGSPDIVLAWPASYLDLKSCTWARFLLFVVSKNQILPRPQLKKTKQNGQLFFNPRTKDPLQSESLEQSPSPAWQSRLPNLSSRQFQVIRNTAQQN